MAFLLGYSAPDGELLEEPLFFSAVAGHDADFVSEDNPYLQAYGSVYDLLKEAVSTSGADAGRLCSCYTYIDCNLDNVRTLDDGGSADIAYLFRSLGLSGSDSPQAWTTLYSSMPFRIRYSTDCGQTISLTL